MYDDDVVCLFDSWFWFVVVFVFCVDHLVLLWLFYTSMSTIVCHCCDCCCCCSQCCCSCCIILPKKRFVVGVKLLLPLRLHLLLHQQIEHKAALWVLKCYIKNKKQPNQVPDNVLDWTPAQSSLIMLPFQSLFQVTRFTSNLVVVALLVRRWCGYNFQE